LAVNVTFFSQGLHVVIPCRLKQTRLRGTEYGSDLIVDSQLPETTGEVKANRALRQAQDAGDV
jgi:hypothetical protein